jgi:hypothetical protein
VFQWVGAAIGDELRLGLCAHGTIRPEPERARHSIVARKRNG